MYALAGAGGVYSACILSELHGDTFGTVLMGVWGVCFWTGGIGNLFFDRKLQRAAQNQNRVP